MAKRERVTSKTKDGKNTFLKRIDKEQLECTMDSFFGRIRRCKYCKTPTKFDPKVGRYCPRGCFRGNKKCHT